MTAVIQLFVLMGIFSVIENCWPSSRVHKWWRRPLLVDLCAWLVHPVSIGFGIALATAGVNALVARFPSEGWWLQIAMVRAGLAEKPVAIQIIIAFLTADFLSYWIHRAYHHFPLLWAFHVVHHTSEELDWLSTSRLHPISQVVDTAVVAMVLLLLGLPVTAVVAANVLIGAAALLVHANVPWTFGPVQHLFVSPVFHQWHHAHIEGGEAHEIGNYGAVLSIWDRLFGTWSLLTLRRPARFGVTDGPPATLLDLALHPIRIGVRFVSSWFGS